MNLIQYRIYNNINLSTIKNIEFKSVTESEINKIKFLN